MTAIVPYSGKKECKKCGKSKVPRKFLRGDDWCRLCRNTANRDAEDIRKKRCTQCKELKFYHAFASGMSRGKIRWASACRECNSDRQTELKPHRKLSEEHKRNQNLLHMYGITLTEYDEILEAQGGVCACCKLPERRRLYGKPHPLCVDHSHTIGGIRGLLCDACNQAIGLMEENPERVLLLLKYIEEKCLW